MDAVTLSDCLPGQSLSSITVDTGGSGLTGPHQQVKGQEQQHQDGGCEAGERHVEKSCWLSVVAHGHRFRPSNHSIYDPLILQAPHTYFTLSPYSYLVNSVVIINSPYLLKSATAYSGLYY